MREGARVHNSLVANGCRIAGMVENSVLSPGVQVEPGAVIRDSVVMSDVMIESGAVVDRAIVDKYVHVGTKSVIGHGEAPGDSDQAGLEGLVLVGKDARIPERTRIGRGTIVGVGADARDFDGADVPARSRVRSRSWVENVR
jgi:glucose-1-phosphate adenylyltransferase